MPALSTGTAHASNQVEVGRQGGCDLADDKVGLERFAFCAFVHRSSVSGCLKLLLGTRYCTRRYIHGLSCLPTKSV